MSLMNCLQRRNALLSLLEIAVFFFIITPLYFIVPVVIAAGVSKSVTIPDASFFNLIAWVGCLPVWLEVLVAGGYILLVIFCWVPGDEGTNDSEVRAFTYFALVCLVLGGFLLQKYAGFVSQMIKNFTE